MRIDYHKLQASILRYRWLVALLVFAVCVLMKLHGSSIAIYNDYLPTMSEGGAAADSEIFGQARAIRSDEWGVQTTTYFSQYYNDYELFSNRKSIGSENAVLDYYAPVKDIVILGKPLSWGYLIFGNEIGLSWYWCSQTILLFMVSFEMIMILTVKNVRLSILGSIMITLAPTIQWFYQPFLNVVFLYAMALFCLGYAFFTTQKLWMKIFTTIVSGPIGVGYALSLYPSLQLTSGIVVVTLLVLCLARDYEHITFQKKEWYRIAIVALMAGGMLGHFVLQSYGDLLAEMNTVYPGKRISVGGDQRISDLFTDLRNVFLPYKDVNVLNNCEVASFIHLGPLFLLLFPKIERYYRDREDKEILVGKGLFGLMLIEIFFMCAGFTEILSEITLFKYVNRMKMTYGWTAVLFSVWCIGALWKYKDIFKNYQKILSAVLYGLICLTLIDDSMLEYEPLSYFLMEICAFVVIILFMVYAKKKATFYSLTAMMCIAGVTVNPLCSGISPITDHPISEFIAEASAEDPDATWITVNTSFVIANFAAANGARVINATNFLPDFDKWAILDEDNQYADIWNRYANQNVTFTTEETYIELIQSDYTNWFLNPNDLEKLGVRYVLAGGDASAALAEAGVAFDEVFTQDGYYVYEVG